MREAAKKFLEAKNKELASDLLQWNTGEIMCECLTDFAQQQTEELQKEVERLKESNKKEVNNLLKSHAEWMNLAMQRKKEVERLKQNNMKLVLENDKTNAEFHKMVEEMGVERQELSEIKEELEKVKEERDALRAFREKDKILSMGNRFDAANKRLEENQQLKSDNEKLLKEKGRMVSDLLSLKARVQELEEGLLKAIKRERLKGWHSVPFSDIKQLLNKEE